MSSDLDLGAYVRDEAQDLAALRTMVRAPLDLSYESINRLEAACRDSLASKSPVDPQLEARVIRYLGVTLISHTGGTWVQGSRNRVAIKIPTITKRVFEPVSALMDFKRIQRAGLLRDYVEEWDLTLQRQRLAGLLAASKTELAALSDDVRRLTGEALDVASGVRCLDTLQTALERLSMSTKTSNPDERRAVHRRTTLFLGSLYAAAIGGGEWTVRSDPEFSTFGQFEIGNWAPMEALRGIRSAPGTLAKNLQLAVDAYLTT